MSRKKRYIQLTDTEILTLEEGHKNGKSYQFRNRCQCLLLSHQGCDTNQLSTIFNVGLVTIYNWFNAWEQSGICGIMNSPGQGRKPKLSTENTEHVEAIEKLVEENYQDVGRIRVELESRFDLSLSIDTVKRYLKKTTFDGAASDAVRKRGRTQ